MITGSTIDGNSTGAGGNGGTAGNTGISTGNGGNGGNAGAGGSGGGIENSGTLSITGSTIAANKTGAGADGGAGGLGGGGAGTTNGSTGTGGNGGNGGGIDSSASLTASNSTFTANATGGGGTGSAATSGGAGGGVNQTMSGATLTQTTIDANNTQGAGGGLDGSAGGTLFVGGSIVASNVSAAASGNCAGSVSDQGHNLTFGDFTCPAGFLNANPKLGTLANNGGPSQTMALQPGSPAIDALPTNACSPPVDQRGVSRPQGAACDIGAYEFAPPSITSPAGTATSTTTATITASVNPNLSSKDTTVSVNYGTTTSYGSSTTAQDIGAADSPASFSAALSGLSPGTTYHAAVIASNGDGTTTSADITFTTLPPLAAALSSASPSGAQLKLTIACSGGDSGEDCSGPITLSSHVTTRHGTVTAVAAAAKKKKPKPSGSAKDETVASGSYTVASGRSTTVDVALDGAGRKLLGQFYKLPVTVAVGGTTTLTKKVTLSYALVRSPISFTWAFGPSSTTAQELTVSKVPKKGHVVVACHGGGCPFAKRSFKPHGGKVLLASQFKGGLKPHATLEIVVSAPGEVAKVATFTIQSGKQPTLVEACRRRARRGRAAAPKPPDPVPPAARRSGYHPGFGWERRGSRGCGDGRDVMTGAPRRRSHAPSPSRSRSLRSRRRGRRARRSPSTRRPTRRPPATAPARCARRSSTRTVWLRPTARRRWRCPARRPRSTSPPAITS